MMRPAWVEVDLAAIGRNAAALADLVGGATRLCPVVKANAYGHGAVEVARAIEGMQPVWGFAVACAEEAMDLREAGIVKPILILGPPPPEGAVVPARAGVSFGVGDERDIELLAGQIASIHTVVSVHLKVNTGMCRMGVMPEEVPQALEALRSTPLHLSGIYSHFATAEDSDRGFAQEQTAAFQAALRHVPTGRVVRHLANSAGLARFPEARFDMVRPGAALYGLNPGVPAEQMPALVPALRLVARVAAAKRLPKGCTVGYGQGFRAQRPCMIALVPVGYADGYPRTLSGKAEVLVRGRRAPVVGAVSMDSVTVDVTDIAGVGPGDEVVLIGAQENERITVEELAQRAGTIVHEIPTRLGPRLPRAYG
jgi:alanine racemase